MAKWQDGVRRGTLAARPAATAVAVGTLYFVTDSSELQRSDGASWQSVESAAGTAANTAAGKVYAYTTFRTAR